MPANPLPAPFGRFVDSVLRGIGQVMLQDNRWTGLLFLLGILVGNPVSGLYALLGTVVATATAMVFGAPRDAVDRGVYGFNGTLVGIALAFYLRHEPVLPVCVVVASTFVTVVTAAVNEIFGTRGRALTGPFVLTTWIFVGAVSGLGRLDGSPALGAPRLPADVAASASSLDAIGSLNLADAALAVLRGPAQVMFEQSAWTGAVFLVALAVNSRVSCAAAILGSALGAGVAWALGAAPGAIRDGLYGFNAVLTAIALGGLFYRLDRIGVLLAALAACVSAVLYASMAAVLGPAGLPALTAPFVITTWLCLFAGPSLARLRAPM